MIMIKFFRHHIEKRKRIYWWLKARKLVSEKRFLEAVQIYETLDFEDGLKQVCMIQTANAFYNLDKKHAALKLYQDAATSEKTWGGRKYPDNSLYIIAYAEFFADVIECSFGDNPNYLWSVERVEKLIMMPDNKNLKRYYLPPPTRHFATPKPAFE